MTEIVGKPKIGFLLNDLIDAIKQFLNWNNKEEASLIGVGPLGRAILGYENFKNYGLNIVSAFDTNKKVVGKKIRGIQILSTDNLYEHVKKKKVKIVVLTTPASVSQEICDNLIKVGIKATWNFSPISLKTSRDIIVESVHLSQSLAVLTHKLANKN